MTDREQFAQLGRAEPFLRVIGGAIWLFVGVVRLQTQDPAEPAWWLWAWGGYGAAYAGAALHRFLPLWLARALIGVQSAAVALMPTLGFHALEGLLMAIVVVELPVVFPLKRSAQLAAAQVGLLLVVVYPHNALRYVFEITGAHSAFASFALLVYWLQQREREAKASLSDAYAELLATRALVVESSRTGERLRIARELHDSLGHHLVALGIQLQLAEKQSAAPAQASVARAQGIAKEALAEVRRVVSSMQVPEQLDFAAALTALASRIPSPVIHLDLAQDLAFPDPERAHALYRCVQEAITNSVKHAEAKNIWVSVHGAGADVEIRVRDDGKGAKKLTPGNGLTGIRERAEGLGGAAVFQSEPGRGFELQLKAPRARPA